MKRHLLAIFIIGFLSLGSSAMAAPVLFCGKTYSPSTKKVVCQQAEITGLDALKGLKQLEELELHGIIKGSLEPLTRLPKLRKLTIKSPRVIHPRKTCRMCRVHIPPIIVRAIDLTPLAKLKSLERFVLDAAVISLKPLRNIRLGTVELTWHKKLAQLAHVAHASDLRLTLSASSLIGLPRLGSLTHLSVSGGKLQNIAVLRHYTGLRQLVLKGTGITDIAVLRSLVRLETLDLSGNRIRSIGALAALTKLRKLSLQNTLITSLSPLTNLTELRYLNISHTAVFSLTPLRRARQLRILIATQAYITTLNGLEGHAELALLNLSQNPIRDISALRGAQKLQMLVLSNTAVSDLSLLPTLRSLSYLGLMGTVIADIAPLERLSALKWLDLRQALLPSVPTMRNATGLKVVQTYGLRIAAKKELRYLVSLIAALRIRPAERKRMVAGLTISTTYLAPQAMALAALTLHTAAGFARFLSKRQVKADYRRVASVQIHKANLAQLLAHPTLKRSTVQDRQWMFCQYNSLVGRPQRCDVRQFRGKINPLPPRKPLHPIKPLKRP